MLQVVKSAILHFLHIAVGHSQWFIGGCGQDNFVSEFNVRKI